MKRIISFFLTVMVLLSANLFVAAQDQEITVFYTNDIHTYIANCVGEGNENNLTFSKLATLKKITPNSLLADAGDHLQGTAYGSMDKGSTIIRLMNETGYDVATIGNHEFDFGMDVFLERVASANFSYLSANFYHEEDGVPGERVLPSYIIKETNGVKIAFIGITTPETITSSAPAYFQNEQGEYCYGISGGKDGSALYKDVQTAIDAAKQEGAEIIIGLGHLGIDPSSHPWTSKDVIANTSGFDAFIDGHSHSVVEMEQVTDQNGTSVILTQTGSYLNNIGKLTISPDGTITSQLLDKEDLKEIVPDSKVKETEEEWIQSVDSQLNQVIGYSQVTLDNYDRAGNRLVRKESTNTGDFAADALYYLFDSMDMDVDVAIMNGGGIRNNAVTGEISYNICKQIHPFGNIACLQTVTGQQLLDALEWGLSESVADGTAENGGFLHISGATFTADLSIPSTVQTDDKGVWIGSPTGEYRVKDVRILDKETGEYQPLDLNKTYNLAGYNYILRNLGDGFAMFDGAVNVLDYVAEDYMILANYIKSFPKNEETGLPVITENEGYSDVNGSGRITLLGTKAPVSEPSEQPKTETVSPSPQPIIHTVALGETLWSISLRYFNTGQKWQEIFQENQDQIACYHLIYVGQQLIIPKNR